MIGCQNKKFFQFKNTISENSSVEIDQTIDLTNQISETEAVSENPFQTPSNSKHKFMAKFLLAISVAFLLSALPSFSVGFTKGSSRDAWWYDLGHENYLRSTWQWIDTDNDGVAECYYFDADGWMYTDTTTPDGYTVDENGAWVVDGEVQTKDVEVKASPKKTTTVKKKQRKNGVIKEYKVHASGSSTGVAPKQGEVNGADFNTEHPADNSKN